MGRTGLVELLFSEKLLEEGIRIFGLGKTILVYPTKMYEDKIIKNPKDYTLIYDVFKKINISKLTPPIF